MGMERMSEAKRFGMLLFVCGCISLLLSTLIPAAATADDDGVRKTRYCLIIPPQVKAAANTPPRTPLAEPVREGTAVKKSFFSGKVEKVGGTPDCFQIGSGDRKKSYAGSEMIYRDLNGYVEALNGDLEIRPFFPSMGYFNRSSKDGTSGMAVGLGFKGPAEYPDEGGARNPSAGVSLMFGFGF
jgi:hypothetical protein